jgi:uncharacterized protein (DUF1330 family)
MKRQITTLLALVAGVGISAAAVQGLHAQTKPRAYTISEFELIDKAAGDAFGKVAIPAVQAAGGHVLNTANGKVIKGIGEAPKGVSVVEWDSLDQAEAYFKSPAYTSTVPYREKAWKNVRSFLVEGTGSYPTLQGSKVYTISEYEPLDKSANNAYSEVAIPAVQNAGGHPSGVGIGKIIARIGEAPKGVTLVGWNSLEQAEAYSKSPAAANLRPQSEKARKVLRSFIVEATQ